MVFLLCSHLFLLHLKQSRLLITSDNSLLLYYGNGCCNILLIYRHTSVDNYTILDTSYTILDT